MLHFIEEREGREYEGMRTPLPLSPPLGSPLTYVPLTSRGGGISPGPVVTVGCLPPGGGVHPRGARLCVRGPPARAGRVYDIPRHLLAPGPQDIYDVPPVRGLLPSQYGQEVGVRAGGHGEGGASAWPCMESWAFLAPAWVVLG